MAEQLELFDSEQFRRPLGAQLAANLAGHVSGVCVEEMSAGGQVDALPRRSFYRPMVALEKWHEAIGEQYYSEIDKEEQDRLVDLRFRLIAEESREATDELHKFIMGQGDRVSLAKELADVLYVVYGTADVFDIPLEEIFQEVHRSNMTKVRPDGTVAKNEFGKVLKGDSYIPPSLERFLD
jgi:NTP pyrophosphatase (non-canonical NTP hydrolase)